MTIFNKSQSQKTSFTLSALPTILLSSQAFVLHKTLLPTRNTTFILAPKNTLYSVI